MNEVLNNDHRIELIKKFDDFFKVFPLFLIGFLEDVEFYYLLSYYKWNATNSARDVRLFLMCNYKFDNNHIALGFAERPKKTEDVITTLYREVTNQIIRYGVQKCFTNPDLCYVAGANSNTFKKLKDDAMVVAKYATTDGGSRHFIRTTYGDLSDRIKIQC